MATVPETVKTVADTLKVLLEVPVLAIAAAQALKALEKASKKKSESLI